ncbi:MAG: hypothetical protein QM687_09920 [Ferruginibacter sp.]
MLLLQLFNNMYLKIAIFFIVFLSVQQAFAADSVYVKFIDKKIEINRYLNAEYRAKGKVYLFIKEAGNDTTLKCFIIKKRKLDEFGQLKLVIRGNDIIALRDGYWQKNSNLFYGQKFFIDDEVFSMYP